MLRRMLAWRKDGSRLMVVQGLPAKGLRAVLSEDGLFVFVSAVMFVFVFAVSMFMFVSAVSASSKRLCIREAAGHLIGAGRIDIDELQAG